MEDLPKAPAWKMQSVSLDGYETAKPVILFYRDPLEVIQGLLRNPIFEGKWAFTARRVYQDPDKQNRLYGDWMTSDGAWSAQVNVSLPLLIHLSSQHSSPLSHQVERSSA